MIIIGNNGYESLFTVYYTLFFIRLGILGDMVFFLVAILKKWHFQEKQLALEKLKAQLAVEQFRNKISAELHDDLGSSLSGISMYSYMAHDSLQSGQYEKVRQSVEHIQKTTDEVITAMSEIIWSINPGNDEFEKIVLRMRNFAFEMLGAKNIDFEFKAEEEVIKMKLPMETRKNLYLIFKEATNNLLKYAGTDKAYFSLTRENNNIILSIRDHGKGFNINAPSIGNGLLNMKKRAEEMNASIHIGSEVGNGTLVKIMIPV
jgi:signal transduction histidine kinase